jgi:hypothetical protein
MTRREDHAVGLRAWAFALLREECRTTSCVCANREVTARSGEQMPCTLFPDDPLSAEFRRWHRAPQHAWSVIMTPETQDRGACLTLQHRLLSCGFLCATNLRGRILRGEQRL